jgi:hypothetical protein
MTLEEVLAGFSFFNDNDIEKIKAVGFRDGEVEHFSVLEFFIKKGNLEAVSLSLENGIDVNSSESGDLVLHFCISLLDLVKWKFSNFY